MQYINKINSHKILFITILLGDYLPKTNYLIQHILPKQQI